MMGDVNLVDLMSCSLYRMTAKFHDSYQTQVNIVVLVYPEAGFEVIAPRRFFLPQKYSTFDDIMKIVILERTRMNRLQYDMFLSGRCLHSAPTFSERSSSKVRVFERMEPVRLASNYLRLQISIRNSRFTIFYSGV